MSIPTRCHLWQKDNLVPEDLAKGTFEPLCSLMDESHLTRRLLKCAQCGQLYLHEFYEEMDWVTGKDSQYSTYIPVDTKEEAQNMSQMSPMEILQFSPRLQCDFPQEVTTPLITWMGKESST